MEEQMMNQPLRISWYRCKVDKAVMSELMRKNEARGFAQAILHLALFAATATLTYQAYLNIHANNWPWALPLMLLCLFAHGSFAHFMGGIACHELSHKTAFKSQRWNEFFLKVYSFLSWFDPIGYRLSHVRHHQVTVHTDEDGEVVLPQGLDWHGIMFIVKSLTFDPANVVATIRQFVEAAQGGVVRHNGFFKVDWLNRLLAEADDRVRREHRNWARIVLFGQAALAVAFVATGHWFLLIVVNFGCLGCRWLTLLCGAPQHVGLSPNVSDFRLCTRTYTCSWFPAFLYWNMQYHLEHHMFPAVPFYNLGRLRQAIEHDLPPAQHGLWRTWKNEILPVLKRQREDRNYVYVPELPNRPGARLGATAPATT